MSLCLSFHTGPEPLCPSAWFLSFDYQGKSLLPYSYSPFSMIDICLSHALGTTTVPFLEDLFFLLSPVLIPAHGHLFFFCLLSALAPQQFWVLPFFLFPSFLSTATNPPPICTPVVVSLHRIGRFLGRYAPSLGRGPFFFYFPPPPPHLSQAVWF